MNPPEPPPNIPSLSRRNFLKKTSLTAGAIALLSPGLSLANDFSSGSGSPSGLLPCKPGKTHEMEAKTNTYQSPFTGQWIKETWDECKHCGQKENRTYQNVPPPPPPPPEE